MTHHYRYLVWALTTVAAVLGVLLLGDCAAPSG
jgi:hypothetical protein